VEFSAGAFLSRDGMRMTPKHQIFVREYLIDLNAAKAARRCGYKESYARRACFALMRKPAIAAAVAEGMAARAKRLEIDADRVMREYAKIGFANIGKLATWGKAGVELRDHKEISEDDAARRSSSCRSRAIAAASSSTTSAPRSTPSPAISACIGRVVSPSPATIPTSNSAAPAPC
jgi:hypothetical protein